MADHSATTVVPINIDMESIINKVIKSSVSINNELADAYVKNEPADIEENKDPSDVDMKCDVADVEKELSSDAAAVKQEVDIGVTVLQPPDIHFMLLPCKPEPADAALLASSGLDAGKDVRRASARPVAFEDAYMGFVRELPTNARLRSPVHQERSASPLSQASQIPLGPASAAPSVFPPMETGVECDGNCGSDSPYDVRSPGPQRKRRKAINKHRTKGSEEESCDEGDFRTESDRRARGGIFRQLSSDPLGSESESEGDPAEPSVLVCTDWPPRPPVAPAPTPRQPPTYPQNRHVSTPGQSYGPTDKFHFEWRNFTESQTSPALRRETFARKHCGSTAPYGHPCDAFTAIWDRPVMEYIAEETNRYAKQYVARVAGNGRQHPRIGMLGWKDTNADELYAFFATILAMGVVVKARTEDYWCSDDDIFRTRGFGATMPHNRFRLLCRCLHFADNATVDFDALTNRQAKLFKVQPIVDHLNSKFSQLYNLGQNISIDESPTESSKDKAASEGYGTYELCDSKTGYLWRFEVRAGAEPPPAQNPGDPISGAIPALVLRLLRGLEGSGRTVWMGSRYHSPALARQLKALGFDCAGALRTNRQFVPSELGDLMRSGMAKGQMFGCTSGDVDLLVWRGRRRVALISTYHGSTGSVCDETFTPTLVQDYNVCAGGVDRNRLLAMCPTEWKPTKAWFDKFFRRILDVSLLNAYILFTHYPHDRVSPILKHRDFCQRVVCTLLQRHSLRPVRVQASTVTGQRAIVPLEYLNHFPEDGSSRRLCRVCGNKTKNWCPSCQTPLCYTPCHKIHHS